MKTVNIQDYLLKDRHQNLEECGNFTKDKIKKNKSKVLLNYIFIQFLLKVLVFLNFKTWLNLVF